MPYKITATAHSHDEYTSLCYLAKTLYKSELYSTTGTGWTIRNVVTQVAANDDDLTVHLFLNEDLVPLLNLDPSTDNPLGDLEAKLASLQQRSLPSEHR